MSGFLAFALNILRIGLVALAVYIVWDPILALANGDATWQQSVDAIFTDKVVVLLLAAIIVSIFISMLDSPLVRGVISVGAVVLVMMFVTGRVTTDSISQAVKPYTQMGSIENRAEACGLDVTTEKVGDSVRTVLKDPQNGEEVLGYIGETVGDRIHRMLNGDGIEVKVPKCMRDQS